MAYQIEAYFPQSEVALRQAVHSWSWVPSVFLFYLGSAPQSPPFLLIVSKWLFTFKEGSGRAEVAPGSGKQNVEIPTDSAHISLSTVEVTGNRSLQGRLRKIIFLSWAHYLLQLGFHI